MGWASKSGRARVNASNPQAFAVCDRCGMWYNLVDLQWQFDWRGAALMNIRILVCRHCLDTPQQQLRAITLPPDPVPLEQPRPEQFESAETPVRITSGQNYTDPVTGIPVICGAVRVTQDNQVRVTQQTGEPPYGLNERPGTSGIPVPGDDDPGLPLGNIVVPETGPLT